MRTRARDMLIAILFGAALAGCSGSKPEDPPADTDESIEAVRPPEPAPAPGTGTGIAPLPEPVPVPEIANVAAPAEPPTEPDAQVLEDADAVGMTARVTRDEAPANDASVP